MYQGRPTTFVVQLFGNRDAAPEQGVLASAEVELPVARVETLPLVVERGEGNDAGVLGESVVVSAPREETPVPQTITPPQPRTEEVLPHKSVAVVSDTVSPEDVSRADSAPPTPIILPAEELPVHGDSYSTLFERMLSAPLTTLTTVYALLALMLLGSLAYAVRYEVTHHHAIHAAEVLLVILILVGLLYVGGTYFFPAPIISMVW
jgi:hypothetical protein